MPCQLQTIMCQQDTDVIALPADISVQSDPVAQRLDLVWGTLTKEMEKEARNGRFLEDNGFFHNRFDRQEYSSNASHRIAAGMGGAFAARFTRELTDLGFKEQKKTGAGKVVSLGLEALVSRAVGELADAPGGQIQRVFAWENEERGLRVEGFSGVAGERGGRTLFLKLTKSF